MFVLFSCSLESSQGNIDPEMVQLLGFILMGSFAGCWFLGLILRMGINVQYICFYLFVTFDLFS